MVGELVTVTSCDGQVRKPYCMCGCTDGHSPTRQPNQAPRGAEAGTRAAGPPSTFQVLRFSTFLCCGFYVFYVSTLPFLRSTSDLYVFPRFFVRLTHRCAVMLSCKTFVIHSSWRIGITHYLLWCMHACMQCIYACTQCMYACIHAMYLCMYVLLPCFH